MDVAHVVAADVLAELAHRFEEGEDLDVAHRPSDLGDHDVHVLGAQAPDPQLDLIGYVRDHLDRLAQVLAPAFLGYYRLVDGPGGGVGVPGQGLVDETLVVAKVEVGLAPVVGDENLAVLEGVHGPRVDIDVGVQFLHRHAQAPAFQQPAQRGGGEALAQ